MIPNRILKTLLLFIAILVPLGCGQTAKFSEPKQPIAPIAIGADLTAIDLCQAIPQEDIQAAMGYKLDGAPQRFNYYDTAGASGCEYFAKEDADGAHFGYVVLTPVEEYGNQPLYKNASVSGIGAEAYFNNGADARQLWVKVNDRVAFVVAFGDQPNEAGAQAIAKLVVAAIQ